MAETIIIADDDTSVISALNMLLKSEGYKVVAVTTPEALIEQVNNQDFTAALIDLNYRDDTTSGQEGLTLIKQIKIIDESLPVIVMTGYSSVEIAVDAMKLGAGDFVQKPWSNERLLHILSTQIEFKKMQARGSRLARENDLLKSEIHQSASNIVACSPTMVALLAQLRKLAISDMSILITGENGTGKSMFAEYVHRHSTRHSQPFISVNMGAIAESLFESEMFGHVKGAFTDAKDTRIGRFELAHQGTIFLDEIANIAGSQQAKLLRVLEERQCEKVGSNKTLNIDVRLICATNAPMQKLIDEGEFRQDLFYRLNTITINIPPLRERLDDIIPMATAFIQKQAEKYRMAICSLSEEAKKSLLAYSWPGNVRELGHVIERAMFLRKGDTIEGEDLALPNAMASNEQSMQVSMAQPTPQKEGLQIDWKQASLDQIEKQIIQSRLEMFEQNPQRTAESLGLSRSAYYRRLEKYQLS
jgi:DNA-binding NtrC family response regulator